MTPEEIAARHEIEFYLPLAQRLENLVAEHAPYGRQVFSVRNNTLPTMIRELERDTQCETAFHGCHVPNLHLDILLGATNDARKLPLCLAEVKYEPQLTLSHFSQLAGYLMVSKAIHVGLLALIIQEGATGGLSGELASLIEDRDLHLNFECSPAGHLAPRQRYRIGIVRYLPGDGVDFVNTRDCGGISSFGELASSLWPELADRDGSSEYGLPLAAEEPRDALD